MEAFIWTPARYLPVHRCNFHTPKIGSRRTHHNRIHIITRPLVDTRSSTRDFFYSSTRDGRDVRSSSPSCSSNDKSRSISIATTVGPLAPQCPSTTSRRVFIKHEFLTVSLNYSFLRFYRFGYRSDTLPSNSR